MTNYLKLLISKSQHRFFVPKDGVHSLFDDFQGMITGIVMMAMGVLFFKSAALYTGGVNGLALVIHYWQEFSLGAVLMVINIPFYILGYMRMGKLFVIKSLVAVSLLSLLLSIFPRWFVLTEINPYFAACMGGLFAGIGLIQIFRHRSSTGGFSILVLYLQDKKGWNAGLVQLILDCAVLSLSLFSGSPDIVIASFLGAAVMNLTISFNHRPGRYISF